MDVSVRLPGRRRYRAGKAGPNRRQCRQALCRNVGTALFAHRVAPNGELGQSSVHIVKVCSGLVEKSGSPRPLVGQCRALGIVFVISVGVHGIAGKCFELSVQCLHSGQRGRSLVLYRLAICRFFHLPISTPTCGFGKVRPPLVATFCVVSSCGGQRHLRVRSVHAEATGSALQGSHM
jgi:hypothetical protein